MDARLSSLAERTASLSEADMSNGKREKEEERLGCFSRLFLSVVFLQPLHEKKEEFTNLRWKKGSKRKSQKCGHDNGFSDAKLPSSELQSTCALCILFFYPHHAVLSNSHS